MMRSANGQSLAGHHMASTALFAAVNIAMISQDLQSRGLEKVRHFASIAHTYSWGQVS
jgi:hypothetical protein